MQVEEVTIINEAKTPPFMIEDETDVNEEIRLKYRYLRSYAVQNLREHLKCVQILQKQFVIS